MGSMVVVMEKALLGVGVTVAAEMVVVVKC
jgi:hypothetical protein